MKIGPGIRLSLIMHGLEDGRVECLCTAARGASEHLLARNVAADTESALKSMRDFIDVRMDHTLAARGPSQDPTQPSEDDLF